MAPLGIVLTLFGFWIVSLARKTEGDSVSVMFNSTGVLANGVPYSVGSGPRGLALSDLDGEGTLDLAVASVDTGAVDILLNNGSGVLEFEASLSVGAGLSPNGDVAAGDFDGNEQIDIATVTTGSAGDFDINGTVDLALTNLNSGATAILVGDGTGSFSAPIVVPGGQEPAAIAASDLSASGGADLVITNRVSGEVGVIINTFVVFADGCGWGDTWSWSSQIP